MDSVLDSLVHLACISGPDSGALIPVFPQWSHIGRDETIVDPLTSRNHCRVRTVSPKRHLGVEIADEESMNGIRTGRRWHPLPGFAPTWALLRARARTVVTVGQVVLIGGNLFEVRLLPAPLSLDRLSRQPSTRQTTGWRTWMLVIPLLSFTWLLARLLSWMMAGIILTVVLATALYVYAARRSRRPRIDPLRILYGLELPATPESGRKNQPITLDLTPAQIPASIHIGNWTILRFRRYAPQSKQLITVGERRRIGIRCEDSSWISWIAAQLVVAARARGIGCGFDGVSVRASGDEVYRVERLTHAGEWDIIVTVRGRPPARRIRRTDDPDGQENLPEHVDVMELPEPVGSLNHGLAVVIGCHSQGPVTVDLAKEGPHALVVGTTGSGKSEALRTWIYQLARTHSPGALRFVFVDYKGGATFSDLAYLAHCEGVVTDLDAHVTERAICGLSAELTEREALLAQYRYSNLEQWENADPESSPPRIICVIDEFRAMIRTHPGLIERFIDVAARGRSLGIHLIAATQSPGGVVSAHMRANLTLRVCFRTAQSSDSIDVLGTTGAAELPRIPGRVWLSDYPSPVQWAYTDRRHIEQITNTSPTRPTLWNPPLPRVISSSDATVIPPQLTHVVAVADDIVLRRYIPLVADRGVVQLVADSETKMSILRTLRTQYTHAIRMTPHTQVNTDVSLDDGEALLHGIRVATLTRTPILIDDISRFIRAIDAVGGPGAGNEIWRTLATTHQAPIIAATALEDMSRYDCERRLLRISTARAKARGLDRAVTNLLETLPQLGSELPLVASGWNLASPCVAALVEGANGTESPPWEELLCAQPFDEHLIQRLKNADSHISGFRSGAPAKPDPQSIVILGRVSQTIEENCRSILPTCILQDHEVMEYDPEDDCAITVLGVLNTHLYRRIGCPIGVRPGAHIWVKWRGWWHKFDK
ncbi:MAG: FtsK/SpoIIIE domain-containing protein [Actinomycetaceae bacterium]|nr:FtsK/SpoIIIE domain-containing protein [Actinomycetaceae bacterium]